MREKYQHNTSFNDWYVFELLSLYLKHEMFQIYEQRKDLHWMKLCHVERHWKTRVELIFVVERGCSFEFIGHSCGEDKANRGLFYSGCGKNLSY